MADLSNLSDAELMQQLTAALGSSAPAQSELPKDYESQMIAADDAAKNGQTQFVHNGKLLNVADVQKYAQPTAMPTEADKRAVPAPQASPAMAQDKATASDQAMRRSIFSGFPMFGQYTPDVAMGARQVLDAAAQMAARGATKLFPQNQTLQAMQQDTENVNRNALNDYHDKFSDIPGSDIARGVGQGVITAPLLPAKAITGSLQLLKAGLQGARQGATASSLTPVYDAGDNFWQQKLDQAKQGAEIGGALGPAANMAGRLLSPNVSDQVKTLTAAGVNPTPGQTMGGVWKSLEDRLTSIPILGDAIKSAQGRSLEQFNRAIYTRVLSPLGPDAVKVAQSAPVGNEGIARIGDYLSGAYDKALAASVPSIVDSQFQTQTQRLAGMVPVALQQDFINAIKNNVVAKMTPSGTLTPTMAKEAESALGQAAASYRGSAVASERQLGQALSQAQANLRAMIARSNPTTAPQIQAINQGWANLVQLENAGALKGAKEGFISPSQYLGAVKKSDLSVRDRAFARGQVRNQDLAQAADSVLSSKYPDSGTAGRGLLAAGLGAAVGGGLEAIHPLLAAGAGSAMLPYTPWGQSLTATLLARRPQSIDQIGSFLKKLSPLIAGPGVQGLLGGP